MNTEQTRPGKIKSQAVKKGKPTWKPASVTDVIEKEPGKRYRLLNKDPDNLSRKKAEGWEIESGVTNPQAHMKHDGSMHTGSNLTSAYERRDVILASMPEELAQERDAYMNEKTRKRTAALTSHFRKEAKEAGNAPVHGEITISSLREQNTID